MVARLQIQLGPHGMRFTPHSEAWEVLGSVQQGQAIGALVRLAAGGYAQVNGDFVRVLNGAQVAYVLRSLRCRASRHPIAVDSLSQVQVKVIVKKRRTYDVPERR
jgi:hypothetical protein